MTNPNVVKQFLEALDERASQVGGLNGGQQYIIGYLNGTLRDLNLQGHEADILKNETANLKRLVEQENKLMKEHVKNDNWIPACGGTEEPFVSRSGKRLQYVWQPSTGQHAYLDLDSDTVLSDEAAQKALALY
jgi:hypothetical protein